VHPEASIAKSRDAMSTRLRGGIEANLPKFGAQVQTPHGYDSGRMAGDDSAGPLGTTNFRVVIGGLEVGCSSVSGLASESEPSDDRAAGNPRLRNVVLRRAVDGSKDLWAWRQAVVDGKEDRRDVAIEHLDDLGERVVNAWTLHEAWPCRWSGPSFDAIAGGVAMEEVELSYLRLTWDHPPDPARDPRTERTPHGRVP
jgi:phage tail-like protein